MPFLPRKNSVGLFGGGKPDDDKEEDAGILAYAKDDNAVSADFRLGSLQGRKTLRVKELIRYGFEELGLKRIWYAYFDGNEKSKRVAEKCGFRYHHTNRDLEWKLLNKTVTEHVYVLEKNRRNDEI